MGDREEYNLSHFKFIPASNDLWMIQLPDGSTRLPTETEMAMYRAGLEAAAKVCDEYGDTLLTGTHFATCIRALAADK